MHKINETSKILTIVGLILEGVGFIILTMMSIMLLLLDELPVMRFSEQATNEGLLNIMIVIHIVLAIVVAIMFVINLVLFTRLIKGELTEQQAKKVYLYQAIWGGINMVINPVTGVLYLVSGIRGYSTKTNKY